MRLLLNEPGRHLAQASGAARADRKIRRWRRLAVIRWPGPKRWSLAPPLSFRARQILIRSAYRGPVDGAERLALPALDRRSCECDQPGLRDRCDHVHRLRARLYERLPDFNLAAGPQAAASGDGRLSW